MMKLHLDCSDEQPIFPTDYAGRDRREIVDPRAVSRSDWRHKFLGWVIVCLMIIWGALDHYLKTRGL